MKHSNQVREFVISDQGLDLVDVYLGPEGVLTGSAREAQQLLEETGLVLHDHAVTKKVIDRHKCSINAISQPGEGATFMITLPVGQ